MSLGGPSFHELADFSNFSFRKRFGRNIIQHSFPPQKRISSFQVCTHLEIGMPRIEARNCLMDNGPAGAKIFVNHFEDSVPTTNHLETRKSTIAQPRTDHSSRFHGGLKARRRLASITSKVNMFSLPKLPWGSSTDSDDKVEISAAVVESLRSEIANAEEREAFLKARLEHLDELLRSARLAGYLYIRTRWTALPGEPPIDDTEVDDWLPRFVVLHGSCIFFYFKSTDLSPQDSTLLSEVVEVGPLPSFIHEDEQTRFTFYILTCHGLRFECSSISKVQVDSWLTALRLDCNLISNATVRDSL